MKNKLMTLIASVGLMASVASANINLDWQSADGFLRQDDATGILEPTGTGLTALAQLIYTPNNAWGQAGVGGTVAAGEQILATFVITDSGGTDPYATFAAPTYVGSFQAGFVYARVFDGGTGNPANIVNGTWYYNGPIVATVNNITPDSPNQYNVNGSNTSTSFGVGDVLFLQVPEPSTMAFLGIGGMILALRRRKA